ncbi:hypothetical protein FKM82_018121 [Ascaphus truei]
MTMSTSATPDHRLTDSNYVYLSSPRTPASIGLTLSTYPDPAMLQTTFWACPRYCGCVAQSFPPQCRGQFLFVGSHKRYTAFARQS